jgi:5S rRNA maturation endonuclease (ribonuclease M5)
MPNSIVVLVEGYTDVIQFNQSGIENVVSSSGTALTDQIRLINRLTKNITVLTVMQPDCVLPFRNRSDSGRRNERKGLYFS